MPLVWHDLGLNPGLPDHWQMLAKERKSKYFEISRSTNARGHTHHTHTHTHARAHTHTYIYKSTNIYIYKINYVNWAIWSINGTLTDTTTTIQSGPVSNDNKEHTTNPRAPKTSFFSVRILLSLQGLQLTYSKPHCKSREWMYCSVLWTEDFSSKLQFIKERLTSCQSEKFCFIFNRKRLIIFEPIWILIPIIPVVFLLLLMQCQITPSSIFELMQFIIYPQSGP